MIQFLKRIEITQDQNEENIKKDLQSLNLSDSLMKSCNSNKFEYEVELENVMYIF